MSAPIPLNQIAFAVLDLKRTEAWWREGLGFLPAGGNRLLFRGPLSAMIQKVPGAAMTCWCLVGRNDWAQLEMFQYESPHSQLMPHDYRPSDHGYSRCGVWVADFDAALARLAARGSAPLGPVLGKAGARRACLRNPDGVYVEIMESDPLPAQNGRGRPDCPVAIRSMTLSTPDLARTSDFLTRGLGMRPADIVLHEDADEALWGLPGARATRRVFIGGSGNESILLEAVEYHEPAGRPFPDGYRLCDQRILNACFGDPGGPEGVTALRDRALAAGATANCPHIRLGIAGCVYVEDPLGFSWEFMWARGRFAHRAFGFLPSPADGRPPADNQFFVLEAEIAAPPDAVFSRAADHARLGEWAGLGASRLIRPGDVERDGRGALRGVKGPLGEIVEEIVDFIPGQSYRYRVLAGLPVSCYLGECSVVPAPVAGRSGTRLTWQVKFRSRIPFAGGLLRAVFKQKLGGALAGLKRACEAGGIDHARPRPPR